MAVVAWPPPTPPNTRANATAQLDNHPSDHNRIADALDTLIARVTPTAWTAIPLGSGFVVGPVTPMYRKESGDVIRLRGIISKSGGTNIANGEVLGTLPAGYRPVVNWTGTAAYAAAPGYLEVRTDGTIVAVFPPSGSNCSLNNVTFAVTA